MPSTTVTIKFEGPPGSGKSLLVELLHYALSEGEIVSEVREHELIVTLTDEDKKEIGEFCANS